MSTIRKLPTIALIAFMLAVLTACLPAPTPPTGTGPLVAVAGDSTAWTAENGDGWPDEPDESFLVPALTDAGFSATLSVMIGATTSDLETVTWPSQPDVLVVVLGHNDLHEGVDVQITATEALSNLDAHLAAVGAECVVLATIPETEPWGLDVNAPAFNAGLAQRADVLLDWAAITAAEPELLKGDGVHHADDGARLRSEIVSAAEECP